MEKIWGKNLFTNLKRNCIDLIFSFLEYDDCFSLNNIKFLCKRLYKFNLSNETFLEKTISNINDKELKNFRRINFIPKKLIYIIKSEKPFETLDFEIIISIKNFVFRNKIWLDYFFSNIHNRISLLKVPMSYP